LTPRKTFDWESTLDTLSHLYGQGDWRVPYLREHAENPFQVLIGTILSQRTKDANTDKASAALFSRYPDAHALAGAPPSEVERLIRTTGFYRTKARHVRATAQAILDRFDGTVPNNIELLLTLPGVGPKTANCVLVFGYGSPGMPVDTHVHRIANRWGLVRTRTPEETEKRLRTIVPREYWIPLNPLLVQHGQNLCRPIRPKCTECPLESTCATGRALRAGRSPPRAEDDPRGRPRRSSARPRTKRRQTARRRWRPA
jgi:endonuclease-3